MNKVVLPAALMASMGLFAVPTVSNVLVSQDECGMVTIAYDLSESAIITMDLMKGEERISASTLAGDVHKFVEAGNGHIAYYRPSAGVEGAQPVSLPSLTVKVNAWTKGSPPDYMAVELGSATRYLLVTNEVFGYYASVNDLPYPVATSDHYKKSAILFRRIPAKGVTFTMGSPNGESGRQSNETLHNVTLTNDYYMSVFPITQGQWRNAISKAFRVYSWESATTDDASTVRGGAASTSLQHADDGLGDICPVENCSSYYVWGKDATSGPSLYQIENNMWLWALKRSTGIERVRLPTEAEWEFACRAGNDGATYSSSNIDDLAWHSGNSGGTTHPVGLKEPNAWGLYDMLGNVWEFCADKYVADHSTLSSTAPFNSYQAAQKVCRGGAYGSSASGCRCARRVNSSDLTRTGDYWSVNFKVRDCGFRIIVDLD